MTSNDLDKQNKLSPSSLEAAIRAKAALVYLFSLKERKRLLTKVRKEQEQKIKNG